MNNYTKEDLLKWNFEKDDYKFYKPIVGEIYREDGKYFVFFKNKWEEMSEQFILNYMNSQEFTIMLERKVKGGAKALSKLIDYKIKEFNKKWKK